MLNYGSVCSGIEAASVAWEPLGWRPAFFSEIEPFPSAVLAARFGSNMPGEPLPKNGVPNHGDFTKIDASAGPIDLLVGGTPCQSFSVAGKRLGLDDPRGNLALEYLALARRLRPRWIVWENVPGVLSSRSGDGSAAASDADGLADGGDETPSTSDFATFLAYVRECGYGFAYRILDAQYVRVSGYERAVPQRRRRVFVVGYLGDWRPAAAVLFEPDGVPRHPPPRRQAWKGSAGTISASVDRRGGGGDAGCGRLFPAEVASTLNATFGSKLGFENQHINAGAPLFVAGTVTAKWAEGAGGPSGDEVQNLVAHTLRGEGFNASEDGCGRGTPLVPVCFDSKGTQAQTDESGAAPTLRAMGHAGSHQNAGGQLAVVQKWAVRRLTPRECERLQGFPQVSEKVIFSAWLEDRLQPHVAAEIQCTTGQSNALSADADAALQFVKNAGQSSNTSQAAPVPPVVLHVLLDCEREVVEIRSAERLIWSASTAERSSASPLSMPPAVFARLVALTTQAAEKTIPDGRVASHRNTARSTHLWSGARSVNLSGQEIGAHADAVAACISDPLKHSTFTISPSIASIPTSALTLTTLCCSVLTAIGSFIPETIQRETSFSLLIETRLGFTAIHYHNKPAANCPDGPRYKACGNSMAVNVMRWIGERIDLFERLMRK